MPDDVKQDPENDQPVKAEEYLEIISTEDERIKIIGEELANDTGRAIFGKVSQGIASPNELAKSLNISLPLINWHINRLLSVGLVKVEKIELSSKNKEMKFYGPVKTALVIIPPEEQTISGTNSKPRKESVLLKLRQYMASFIALAISAPIIYVTQKLIYDNTMMESTNIEENQQLMAKTSQSAPSSELARSTDAPLSQGIPFPEPSIWANDYTMILVALGVAGVIFLVAFVITKFYSKKKKDIIQL